MASGLAVNYVYIVLNKRKSPRPPLTQTGRLQGPAAEFVERMGHILESDGHSRIAGRMVGLLLLTEGDTSLDDLAAQLEVSKPSVSINARLLEDKGVLERAGRVGDRRDYYRIAADLVARMMELRLAKLQRLGDAVRSAKSAINVSSASVASRLNDFAGCCDHMARVTESALSELHGRRRTKAKSVGGTRGR